MDACDPVAYRAYGESFYLNLRSLCEFFTRRKTTDITADTYDLPVQTSTAVTRLRDRWMNEADKFVAHLSRMRVGHGPREQLMSHFAEAIADCTAVCTVLVDHLDEWPEHWQNRAYLRATLDRLAATERTSSSQW